MLEPSTSTARRTGETHEWLGVACEKIDLYQGRTRVQEVWLARWAQAGMTAKHFTAVRQLARSADKVLSAMSSSGLVAGFPEIPLAGVAGLEPAHITMTVIMTALTVLRNTHSPPYAYKIPF